MMKKIIYILLFAVLGSSCDNFVDITPKGYNIPTTVDDLAKILNYSDEVSQGGKNWFYMTDDSYLPEERLKSIKSSSRNAYLWAPYMYSALEQDPDWAANYKVLYYANYVLEHIQTAPESSSKIYDRTETYGRALLHRAYSYWYLLSVYAPYCKGEDADVTLAVPLRTTSDINMQSPRATVAKVFQQIFEDIDAALALDGLPDWSDVGSKHCPCKAAACALLSRIYLWLGDWEKAADNAAKVLAIQTELTNYNDMSLIDSEDVGMGINGFSSQAYYDPEVILNKYADGYNFMNVIASENLVNCYDRQKDLRFRFFFSDKDDSGNSLTYFMRMNQQELFDGLSLPEVYLNRIEALVRLGGADNLSTARRLLDTFRSHRYENPDVLDDGMTQMALLEEILLERRRELRFTYMRWIDMKRLGVQVSRKGLNGEMAVLTGDSPRYTFAIPLDVINYNSQLEQNER